MRTQHQFRLLLEAARDRTGLEFPGVWLDYVTETLVKYVDRPDLVPPEEAFAIQLMTSTTRAQFQDVGDRALWVSGVLPGYRQRRGMTRSYYISIGQMAYASTHIDLLVEMSEHLDSVSDLVLAATHPHTNLIKGL